MIYFPLVNIMWRGTGEHFMVLVGVRVYANDNDDDHDDEHRDDGDGMDDQEPAL